MITGRVNVISGRAAPSDTISITSNGTVDVTDYAAVCVAVPNDSTVLNSLINGSITEIVNNEVTSIRAGCFSSINQNLKYAIMNNVRTINTGAFQNSFRFRLGQFNSLTSGIPSLAFGNCYDFATLIIKGFVGVNSNAFLSTKFNNANGSATGGTLYTNYENVGTYSGNSTWNPKTDNVPDYNRTFKSIQENLVELQALGADISDFYEIVDELPASNASATKVYFVLKSGESNVYEQHFYNGTAWSASLPDITLTL